MPAGAAGGVFELGALPLECGTVLPNAKIAYQTHGRLNATGDNAILYPTQVAAQHGDIERPIGPGKALDPGRYFIVALDQLGNGLSSSPSNTPAPTIARAFRPSRFATTAAPSIVS